ncbi:hypothetical protein K431DRAFT_321369 [Polychaeton citri CBS 116435]|uniref:Uncharacterized protein n=1 Tax=Polychaeton citri CBS 116435 TaxID=1314669 RepID=A0A9P4Q501_9PEZI|nr:hypothetical protein K431DRAFT_321369 [Polychaeton citri CBS 116435]
MPVPRAHLALTHKDCTYILTERSCGQPRTLGPQSHTIGNINRGSLYNPRIPSNTRRYLEDGIQAYICRDDNVTKLIILQGQKWDALTLIYGDLSGLNTPVRGDDVVGVVKWEATVQCPSHWSRDKVCNFLETMPEVFTIEQLQ